MPRYIGERHREMYYQRDGKWHHLRDNGRCFDTLEDARRDFDNVCPSLGGVGCGALLIFLVGVLLLKMAAGM